MSLHHVFDAGRIGLGRSQAEWFNTFC